jgi:hypothetical protein
MSGRGDDVNTLRVEVSLEAMRCLMAVVGLGVIALK